MNKLQINRMATTVLFAVLVLVSSVALAQKPIKRPPKKVRQTTTQQVAKPPKKTVTPPKATTGAYNGREWVDLGLSVKWATRNVHFADTLENYHGDFNEVGHFAWGDPRIKSEFTGKNCVTMGLDLPDISGDEWYDVARLYWGKRWRMPTIAEFEELKEKCKWEWTTDGLNGMKVTGPNGNSIFLPAEGGHFDDEFKFLNEFGGYWSSTPENTEYAFVFFVDKSGPGIDGEKRSWGYSIRPVTE